jgi:CO/xanthine dehydrogenase FAD-binding subunit
MMSKRLGRLRRLPEMEVLFPKTLGEALSFLKKYSGAAKAIAGGTDLIPKMKRREIVPKYLIDLKGVADLNFINYEVENGLRIGSLTTLNEIRDSSAIKEHCPILVETVSQMASVQVRNMATMAGNLCNAVPSADTAPPLIALGATLKLSGPEGERTVLVEEFFNGPGETALEPLELLAEIQIPPARPGEAGTYLKHTLRAEMDLALVGVAAYLALNSKKDICEEIRIAMGAVAPTPVRAKKAEEALRGKPISDTLIETAGSLASEESSPIDDIRGSAEYRKEMVRVLTKRAIKQSWERAKASSG